MSTSVTENGIIASRPYPEMGASQHLCLIRDGKSTASCDPSLQLNWESLPNTVLAGAFVNKEVYLPTPLPAPNNLIKLPPLHRRDLRERPVMNAGNQRLGTCVNVPGLFVAANRMLLNYANKSTQYDYAFGINQMALEAARMFATSLNRGILRVREKPGIMGHIQAVPELGYDEIGISEAWAEKILARIGADLTSLDGFPCWGIRYPIANEFGIEPMILRVLPGLGRFVGFNPWTLGKRKLGDEDGDLGYSILRTDEVFNGLIGIEKRPRIHFDRSIDKIQARLTLQNLHNPDLLQAELGLNDKQMAKLLARYDTQELRLQAIEDADTRTHVAVYTMVIGWYVARTLMASGVCGRMEAYQRAFNTLEPFLESAMDARKPGSAFSGNTFDSYKFMETLLRGGNLPIQQLEEVGIPLEALEDLQLAWSIASGRLGRFCSRSPVFQRLIVQNNSLEISSRCLLETMRIAGVEAGDVYRTIVDDLAGVSLFSVG